MLLSSKANQVTPTSMVTQVFFTHEYTSWLLGGVVNENEIVILNTVIGILYRN